MQEAHFASTGAAAVDGTRLRFLQNWSCDPASVSVPTEVHDILTGETFHTQRSRPTRALGCSGACSETTVTADGRAAAVGVGTVRERDWLFDGHARIGEALDD